MELSVDQRTDVAVVAISGSVDSADSIRLQEFLNELIDNGQTCIVADLSGMNFVVSMGLSAFVRTYIRLREVGGYLRLAEVQPPIMQIIKTTALDRLLPIYESLDQALE